MKNFKTNLSKEEDQLKQMLLSSDIPGEEGDRLRESESPSEGDTLIEEEEGKERDATSQHEETMNEKENDETENRRNEEVDQHAVEVTKKMALVQYHRVS